MARKANSTTKKTEPKKASVKAPKQVKTKKAEKTVVKEVVEEKVEKMEEAFIANKIEEALTSEVETVEEVVAAAQEPQVEAEPQKKENNNPTRQLDRGFGFYWNGQEMDF